MAKGSGTTRRRTSGNPRGLSDVSEREFASVTGMRYGHPVDTYRAQLAVANGIPDNQVMWTGHTAKEVKDYLKMQIRKMGGSTRVGRMSDWFIEG